MTVIWTAGSLRIVRRPRGGRFCEANRGSASSRALVLVLKPALAAAVRRLWIGLRFHVAFMPRERSLKGVGSRYV